MSVPISDCHELSLEVYQSEHDYIITEPIQITLNDPNKTIATLVPINNPNEINPQFLEFLHDLFNKEIEIGKTYPQYNPLTLEEFRNYWFGKFTAILMLGDIKKDYLLNKFDFENEFLGSYYIKPNYAGRCSHNCNAGFLVNFNFRNTKYKIGINLGKSYLNWAPLLGYKYSVFNLVFVSNKASVRIWDSLGFERIGYIKNAGRLKGEANPVDAIIFGKDL